MKSIEIKNGVIVIDVLGAMKENISVADVEMVAESIIVESAKELMDLVNTEVEIEFTNEPKELKSKDMPDTMTGAEFREINNLAEEGKRFTNKVRKVAGRMYIFSDDTIETIIRRDNPDFTDLDIKNVFSMGRDIWRVDSEWVQNLDSLVDLVVATKKDKYVFA